MRTILSLSSSLFAMTLAAGVAAAPSSFVLDVPSDMRVSLQQPVASAKDVLTRSAGIPSHVDLAFDRERTLRGVRVLRFRQQHKGLPVFGRGAAIAVDIHGVSRLASSRIETNLPDSIVPTVSPEKAASVASKASGLDASAANTRLLLWPTPQGTRLAYSVLPPALLPIPYAPVVIVDAVTGQTLTVHNLVRHQNLANVHEFNPIATPTPIQVTLPIDEPFTVPQNDLLVSYNCVDMKNTTVVNYMGFNVTVHICDLLQNAEADPDTGNYTQYELEDHTSGGDPYAQISIFYHTAKAYEYFKGFDPGFELEEESNPLFLVANLMLPAGLNTFDLNKMADPDLPLEPFSNAFSMGWDPMMGEVMSALWPQITGGALMFGQGKNIDYAYDGDVVYHEFGHSVVGSTIGLVGWWHLDEQGASASPGAMNEALADFFSSSITMDPVLGEYAAQETGASFIRDLENSNVCPTHLAGQVHNDSEFFSAALWAARSALSNEAERFAFEEAIFTAISTAASGDIGFEDLAELFVAAVEGSSLGASKGDALRNEFTSRGVLPSCQRMFLFDGTPISSQAPNLLGAFVSAGKSMFAAGAVLPYAPGTFQVEVSLPEGSTSLTASFMKLALSGGVESMFTQGTPFTPAFIVSFDEPLTFDWAAKTSNASDPADCELLTGSQYGATIDIPDGSKKAYVMLVNKGDQDGYFKNMTFDFHVEVPADAGVDADEPLPDAGTEQPEVPDDAGDQPSAPAEPVDDSDGGCGCRTVGGPSQGAGLAALIALAFVGIARRRKNGTIRS